MSDTTNIGGVSFEEEHVYQTSAHPVSKKGLAAWLNANLSGILKSEKEANYFLMGFAIIGLVVSVILFSIALRPIPKPPADPIEIATPTL